MEEVPVMLMNETRQEYPTFQSALSRKIVRYGLLPVILMITAVMLFVIMIGWAYVSNANRNTTTQIAASVETSLEQYSSMIEGLSLREDLFGTAFSTTKRQKIAAEIYHLSLETHMRCRLYFYSEDRALFGIADEEQARPKRNVAEVLDAAFQHPNSTVSKVYSIGANRVLYLSRYVRQGENASGYLVVEIDSTQFAGILQRQLSQNVLVDENGWIFSGDIYTFSDAVGRLDKSIIGRAGFVKYRDRFYYTSWKSLFDQRLSVYSMSDISYAVIVMITVMLTGLFVSLLLGVIQYVRAGRVLEETSEEVVLLNDVMQHVSSGNLDRSIELHSCREFRNIGSGFNQMMESLKKHMETNQELAEMIAFSSVKQLVSQFNSHFLFNTLDNIRFMCRIDPELAEQLVLILSELLRYQTENPHEKVTVEEDFAYIHRYFEIIQMRLMERISYQMELEDGIGQCFIPKLLLQPIIENAIKYGFGDHEHLSIHIRGYGQGKHVIFVCRDDGVGIAPDLLKRLQIHLTQAENTSTHLGLYNVHRRLQLMYGKDCGIHLDSTGGTTVTITLNREQ